MGPLLGRMAGRSEQCRSRGRLLWGLLKAVAAVVRVVFGVGMCIRVAASGVWVVPTAVGCGVGVLELGVVGVGCVAMPGVGVAPVGPHGVEVAVVGGRSGSLPLWCEAVSAP